MVVFSVSIVVSVPLTARFPPTKRLSCIYESPRMVTTLGPVSSTENLDPTSSVWMGSKFEIPILPVVTNALSASYTIVDVITFPKFA